ncbi:MAG: polysaccharide biosynthesis protein [Promethearchaeota archaeon]
MSIINNKIILITGATGSIGEHLLDRILKKYSPKVIRVFSRDESKQFSLEKRCEHYNKDDILRFFIGDIRDKLRVERAIKNVDIVIHLAALKHVGACEYNPFEAIKTNILGIQNLIEASIDNNIERFLFTSSDKAATPSNTMGVTKLLGEKLITAANYYKGPSRTIFSSVRFGNVLGSRGSLVPLIEEQVLNNRLITLTHREMTRYIMSPEQAIDLILKSLEMMQGGEVFVAKMKIVRIYDLIKILIEFFSEKHKKKAKSLQIKEIGMFAGEKLYEELFSVEEAERTFEMDDIYVIIPQLKEVSHLINKALFPNLRKFNKSKPFISKEGIPISKEQIKNFLIKNKVIKDLGI